MDDELNKAALQRVAQECSIYAWEVARIVDLYRVFEDDPDACICAAWYPHECSCHASWEDE